MAEGIALNFAEAILKQAGSLTLQEIAKIRGVKGELSKLEQTVTRIQKVLLDAEENRDLNNQEGGWLDELKDVAYDVDDLLDDFAVELLRRKAMGGPRLIKEVRIFFSRSNQLFYGHVMAGRIKDVRGNMDRIADDKLKFHMDVRPKEKARQKETDSSSPNIFVGREGDRDHVIRLLIDSDNQESASVISLVGIGGIGKTALAQVIFNDERVRTHFDLTKWVYVSDLFDVKMVAKKILESVTEDLPLDTVLNRLKSKIGGKRFLVVLDEVWSKDGEKWDNIRKLLRVGAKGSKIMVTTRFKEVARIASPSFHILKGLSFPDSWALLKQMVFDVQEVKNAYAATMGEKIVRACDGVPLAIKSIGNLLRLNDAETKWSNFVNWDPLIDARIQDEILETLRSSYHHLPLHLKHCFAYCTLFPKDFIVDVESLIHMWVAQGFITKSSGESRTLEETGLEYYMDLSRMSFFEDMEKDSLGRIKSFKLPHLMHRLATTVASADCKMMVHNKDKIVGNIRHASLNFDLEPPQGTPDFLVHVDQLRTFLLLDQGSSSTRSRTWEESSCKALLSCFKRLRVMDLHNAGIENLSSSVKGLKHIRYLDVSRNTLRLLPRSISKLQSLQVLKFSDCTEIRELPEEIAKLVNLKHLYCEGCLNLVGMPIGLANLVSLQTLTWFVVFKGGPRPKHIGGLGVLKSLKSLRGRLEIRNLGRRKTDTSEFEDANLEAKKFLQSLTLRWKRDDDTKAEEDIANYDEQALSGLQPHPNLRELQVYGYGGASFPGWLSSLTNLVNIRLDGCQSCQSLPPLSPIHSLRELCIVDLTVLEYMVNDNVKYVNRGDEETIFFPSLKTLLLLNCPKLKGWKKATGGGNDAPAASLQFPSLSLLEVKNCPELTSLPQLPTPNKELSLKDTTNLEPAEQLLKIKMAPTQNQGLNDFPSWLAIPKYLVEVQIKDCQGCELLPALDQIAFLKHIHLENLPHSQYIDVDNDNSQGEGLAFFPFLKKLWIYKCPELRGWQKKGGSGIRATGTPIAPLPQFPCLSMLDIRDCDKLSMMPSYSPTIDDNLYLSNSSLLRVPSSLPSFTNVRQMWINNFPALEFLDLDRKSYITGSGQSATIFPCLTTLWLENCPKLKGWWKMTDDEAQTMKTEEFPQFSCLSYLEIRNCFELSWMPTFPTVQKGFYFINSGAHAFPKSLSSFRNLTQLQIGSVKGLTFIESEADVDSLAEEQASTVLPHLEKLYIDRCHDLKGWWNVTNDRSSAPRKLPYFPRLSAVEIEHCPDFTLMPLFPTLDAKLVWDNTSTASLRQTMKMRTWAAHSMLLRPLSKLKVFQLKRIKDLDSLPEEWLQNLTSLEELYIESCTELKSLPQGICYLTSLKKLEIWYCPQLTERCKRNTGVDWHHIKDILQIKIDGKDI